MFAACVNNGNEQLWPEKVPIRISIEQTRANDTSFDEGDQIGLYVVNYENSTPGTLLSSGNYVDNMRFTYTGYWTPDEAIYWKDQTTKTDVYAYYPYNEIENVSEYPFNVLTDQSNEANYFASDFLWGKREAVDPTHNVITIETEHIFSNALIYIAAGEGFSSSDIAAANIEVEIRNVKTEASIDITSGKATAVGEYQNITPWYTGECYRAMIVPQTFKTGSNLIYIKVNDYEYTYSTDIDFAANTQHKFTITVGKNSNGITVNIKEWQEDQVDHGGNAEIAKPANNEIWYTSTDGNVVTPTQADDFGANIVSNTYENGKGIITFDATVTSIGFMAFRDCSSLTSITIPNSVTSIGFMAFSDCSSLTSITIPNSVTSIGSNAFSGCSSLTSITIPNSVTSIGDGAFFLCSNLTEITIPESVEYIGVDAFGQCKIKQVNISNLSAWCNISLYNSGIFTANIETALYVNGYQVTELIIPSDVEILMPQVFAGLTNLKSVTIPNSVTAIGEEAFAHCHSLTSVTIPDSVTFIGDMAFVGCVSLTSVTIPNSVTSIEIRTFAECNNLVSITIPDSVTSIGSEAFSLCDSLKDVYCKPTTPPTGDTGMFFNNASGRKIYVPHNSVEAYKAAKYWSDYAEDIVGYDF